MQVELHPEAEEELDGAASWYDDQRPGLGDELVAEVASTLTKVAASPEAFSAWPGAASDAGPIRRARVDRFPYLVAFELRPGRVRVLALAHAKRRPLYWIARAGRSR